MAKPFITLGITGGIAAYKVLCSVAYWSKMVMMYRWL